MYGVDIQGMPQRGWLERHWKLALVILLVVAVLFTVAVCAAVFLALSNSEVPNKAFELAKRNPMLTERLGSPLRKGWLVAGSIETTAASGHAELAVPISGPKGSGTLYVEAHKEAGLWKIDLLQFGSKGSDERMDLLLSTPGASQAQ